MLVQTDIFALVAWLDDFAWNTMAALMYSPQTDAAAVDLSVKQIKIIFTLHTSIEVNTWQTHVGCCGQSLPYLVILAC